MGGGWGGEGRAGGMARDQDRLLVKQRNDNQSPGLSIANVDKNATSGVAVTWWVGIKESGRLKPVLVLLDSGWAMVLGSFQCQGRPAT